MFRLAHISDVHLSPLPEIKWHQLLNKRITGYLNWKLNRKHAIGPDTIMPLIEHMKRASPDHVAVTGDLVNLSLPAEFTRARGFLEQLGTSEGVSVVCGNHDAYVPGALQRALTTWSPYLGTASKKVERKRDFPYLRKIGDIALIGCNSADATAPFFATGYFKNWQAKKLEQILQETRGMCRIIMIHHPPIEGSTPHHKRLIGAELFRKVIANHGAELILHGHTHLADKNELKIPAGNVPVIGVPATGNGFENSKPPGRYNLFEIDRHGKQWKIVWSAHGASPETGEISLLDSAKLY